MAALRPRLSEAIEDYIRSRRSRHSAGTVKQDAFVTRRFLLAVGDVYTHNLTARHVEDWFVSLTEPHKCRDGRTRPAVAASTYNYYYARIKALARYLQVRGMLRSDVMALVQPRRTDKRERLQPGRQVLLSMLEGAHDPRDRAILACAMNTGLRASEISSLRLADVDLDRQTLHVRISKSRLEDGMPLTLELGNELRQWLTTYEASAEKFGRALQSDHFLFPARLAPSYGWVEHAGQSKQRVLIDRGWDPSRGAQKLHRVAQAALQRVGFPTKGEGIHTIRRAAARLLFDALINDRGYDGALRVTSAFLHHSNGSTTEAYLGLNAERKTRDDFLRGRSLYGWGDPSDSRMSGGGGSVRPIAQVR